MRGYAPRQAIGDVLGHFWSKSFGQIYLGLQRSGPVTRRRAGRPGAPWTGPYFLLTVSAGEHAAPASIAQANESLAALEAMRRSAQAA